MVCLFAHDLFMEKLFIVVDISLKKKIKTKIIHLSKVDKLVEIIMSSFNNNQSIQNISKYHDILLL